MNKSIYHLSHACQRPNTGDARGAPRLAGSAGGMAGEGDTGAEVPVVLLVPVAVAVVPARDRKSVV